jgi:Zn-dependent peptidase ImmA (M78 family)
VVKSNKVDTFSRYSARMAVIVPNEQMQSSSVWNFDIAHELGHMVMHRGIPTGNIETEREANAFAGAFLMPARTFGREFQALPFSWDHVFRLKKRWSASAAAIVRRAYDLNLLGAVEYRAALKHMSREGWNKREPHESRPQQSGVFEKVLDGLGQKATLTIDLPIEKLCEQLCFTTDAFYEVTGIAIQPRNIPPSRGTEMRSAVPSGSPNPSEPVVATTPASDSASAPVVAQREPPKQIPKPAPTPEELGVLGLDSIPPGAEVVWVTSSENVAKLARNQARPIVVMKEWHSALRDHSVFRDVKVLWHIQPEQSNALHDPEKEASRHLQASLEADPKIKSRLRWANANAVPAEAFQETATPPPGLSPQTGSIDAWRVGGSGASGSFRNPSGAIEIPSEDPDSPEAIRKRAGGLLGT